MKIEILVMNTLKKTGKVSIATIINKLKFSFILFWCISISLMSCASLKFVDKRSTFEEWRQIPNNGKYLKLDFYYDNSKKKIRDREYYLTFDGCNKSNDNIALVEVNLKRGILNKFPIPSNKSSLILNDIDLFPPPSLLQLQLEVYATYTDNTVNLVFSCTKQNPGENNQEIRFEKVVILDFNTKVGFIKSQIEEDFKIWN
jgi:hypothetical protein